MSKKIDYIEYIEGHTLRLDVSHRGGGIEIDAGENFTSTCRGALRAPTIAPNLGCSPPADGIGTIPLIA